MNFFKFAILNLSLVLLAASASAQQETAYEREFSRDETAVREFVESKENIDVRAKSSNLEVSGDVRFVYDNKQEKGIVLCIPKGAKLEDLTASEIKERCVRMRGGNFVNKDGLPVSCNDYNVKFNLKMKYDFDQCWAMAQVQFNTLAGISSVEECRAQNFPVYNFATDRVRRIDVDRSEVGKGSASNVGITLKRSYIGKTLYADGKQRLDLEIGRQKLDDLFMSEIEFDNYFDGCLFDYARDIDGFSDFYGKIGAFVIDQRVDHYGWVTEFGFLDIMDTDIDVRYSYIDWMKKGYSRCFVYNPTGSRYQISQFTLSYALNPTIFCKEIPIELYGAFLINTAASKNKYTLYKKSNIGWYVDIFAGNVLKKGDWSVEFVYAYVQAQALPDFDSSGPGRGNILNQRMQDRVEFFQKPKVPSDSDDEDEKIIYPRCGNTNYHGFSIDFVYGVTDNFLIDIGYAYTQEIDRSIGGLHHYQNIEIEFLYAF